jgi:hypothetical protein
MTLGKARKFLAVALTALTIGTGVFATTSGASARPIFFPRIVSHFNHGPHFGFGIGAAIVGGLVAGAIVAHAESERECYFTNRRSFDDYGNEYIRQVRVCE